MIRWPQNAERVPLPGVHVGVRERRRDFIFWFFVVCGINGKYTTNNTPCTGGKLESGGRASKSIRACCMPVAGARAYLRCCVWASAHQKHRNLSLLPRGSLPRPTYLLYCCKPDGTFSFGQKSSCTAFHKGWTNMNLAAYQSPVKDLTHSVLTCATVFPSADSEIVVSMRSGSPRSTPAESYVVHKPRHFPTCCAV